MGETVFCQNESRIFNIPIPGVQNRRYCFVLPDLLPANKSLKIK